MLYFVKHLLGFGPTNEDESSDDEAQLQPPDQPQLQPAGQAQFPQVGQAQFQPAGQAQFQQFGQPQFQQVGQPQFQQPGQAQVQQPGQAQVQQLGQAQVQQPASDFLASHGDWVQGLHQQPINSQLQQVVPDQHQAQQPAPVQVQLQQSAPDRPQYQQVVPDQHQAQQPVPVQVQLQQSAPDQPPYQQISKERLQGLRAMHPELFSFQQQQPVEAWSQPHQLQAQQADPNQLQSLQDSPTQTSKKRARRRGGQNKRNHSRCAIHFDKYGALSEETIVSCIEATRKALSDFLTAKQEAVQSLKKTEKLLRPDVNRKVTKFHNMIQVRENQLAALELALEDKRSDPAKKMTIAEGSASQGNQGNHVFSEQFVLDLRSEPDSDIEPMLGETGPPQAKRPKPHPKPSPKAEPMWNDSF